MFACYSITYNGIFRMSFCIIILRRVNIAEHNSFRFIVRLLFIKILCSRMFFDSFLFLKTFKFIYQISVHHFMKTICAVLETLKIKPYSVLFYIYFDFLYFFKCEISMIH